MRPASDSIAFLPIPDDANGAIAVPPGELILLARAGAVARSEVLARAEQRLRSDDRIDALIDLPERASEGSLLLDLLLRPEEIRALFVRRDVLLACGLASIRSGPAALARICIRVGSAFAVARRERLVDNHESASREQIRIPIREADRLACEGLVFLAIEDLYPELREPYPQERLHERVTDCALHLIKSGRRRAGFTIGRWIEQIIQEHDHGLPLDLVEPCDVPEFDSPDCKLLRPIAEAPLVSIIIATLNRSAMLSRALRSIACQTLRDVEVIVVNDGGEDPWVAVEAYRDLQGGDGRVTLIHHDRNRGLAAARNTGLRAARGRYVGFLDDDDCLLPNHLAVLVPHLRRGASIVISDARGVIERPARPLPITQRLDIANQFEYDPVIFHIDNYLPVQSILCDREVLQLAGEFDETLPVLEDWDYWLRVFALANPLYIRRITTEVRLRSDRTNMSDLSNSIWAQVQARIYAKTIHDELDIPGLRKLRVEHLLKRLGAAPFPDVAQPWLRGAPGLAPIDPENPLAGF